MRIERGFGEYFKYSLHDARILKIEHIILVNTIKAFCENRIIFNENRAFIVEE